MPPDGALPVELQMAHPVGGLHERRARANRGIRDTDSIRRDTEAQALLPIIGDVDFWLIEQRPRLDLLIQRPRLVVGRDAELGVQHAHEFLILPYCGSLSA